MSEEHVEQHPATIHELVEDGREKLARAQDGAQDALGAATEYIKANPWVAVAGAALIGGAVAALLRPKKPSGPDLNSLRDWLGDAYAKLPSREDVQEVVKSSGAQKVLKQLAQALHLR